MDYITIIDSILTIINKHWQIITAVVSGVYILFSKIPLIVNYLDNRKKEKNGIKKVKLQNSFNNCGFDSHLYAGEAYHIIRNMNELLDIQNIEIFNKNCTSSTWSVFDDKHECYHFIFEYKLTKYYDYFKTDELGKTFKELRNLLNNMEFEYIQNEKNTKIQQIKNPKKLNKIVDLTAKIVSTLRNYKNDYNLDTHLRNPQNTTH